MISNNGYSHNWSIISPVYIFLEFSKSWGFLDDNKIKKRKRFWDQDCNPLVVEPEDGSILPDGAMVLPGVCCEFGA